MTQIYGNHMATGDRAYCMGDEDISRTGLQSLLHRWMMMRKHMIVILGYNQSRCRINRPMKLASMNLAVPEREDAPFSLYQKKNEKNPPKVTSSDHRRQRKSLPNFEVLNTSIEKMANVAEKMSTVFQSMTNTHNRIAVNAYISTVEDVIAKLSDLSYLQRSQVAHVIITFGRDDKA